MKTQVTNLTQSTLVLNKLSGVLAGGASRTFDITTDDQRIELDVLQRAKVISCNAVETIATPFIVATDRTSTTVTSSPPVAKNKGGRPKGSKNKPKVLAGQSEQRRVTEAEARTQQEGSRVVITNGKQTFETKMRKSYANDLPETEATKASLEAMEKLEREERGEDVPPPAVDESKLNPSEQKGGKATIMREGVNQKVDLTNNAVRLKGTKDVDPFIDREANAQREELLSKQAPSPLIDIDPDADIDGDGDGDDHSDAFIE